MRSLKRRRNLDIVLAFASVFGGSADHSHSVVAVVAAEEEEATAEHQHKDLIERYLQAISEQDDPGAAAVVGVSEENESCFAGWDASCQDNPSFRSVMGASCRTHIPFECTMLHAIGYNEQEVYDVINNCPCACKVPCGQWTFTPSAEPSSSPSSTPSASPSVSPTSQPSEAPSSSPTSIPSSSPSATPSAAPTASPSSAPSFSPTISMAPSASPTASPSASPSSSPTSPPSSAPTATPSSSPSASPSATPSVSPTSSPSSSPTSTPTPYATSMQTGVYLRLVGLSSTMDGIRQAIFEETAKEFISDSIASLSLVTSTAEDGVEVEVAGTKILTQSVANSSSNGDSTDLLIELSIWGMVHPHKPPADFSFPSTVLDGFVRDFLGFTDALYESSDFFHPLGHSDNPEPSEIATQKDNQESSNNNVGIAIGSVVAALAIGLSVGVLAKRNRDAKNPEDSSISSMSKDFQRPFGAEALRSPVCSPRSPNTIESGGSSRRDWNVKTDMSPDAHSGMSGSDASNLTSKTKESVTAKESVASKGDIGRQIGLQPNEIQCESYDCYAPPGPLGVVLESTPEGPMVHSLKPASRLASVLSPGDLVVGVDDIDTRGMTATGLARLMVMLSQQPQRKISLLSAGTPSEAGECEA